MGLAQLDRAKLRMRPSKKIKLSHKEEYELLILDIGA
jgi:hypothetical protein